MTLARRRFAGAGRSQSDTEIEAALESIQRRYMDDSKSPARRALERALRAIVDRRSEAWGHATVSEQQRSQFVDIMRRFLRVPTTLVRCFPIHEHDTLEPHLAVRSMLDKEDGSGLSWRDKFEAFIDFLVDRCSSAQREAYVEVFCEQNSDGGDSCRRWGAWRRFGRRHRERRSDNDSRQRASRHWTTQT